MLRLKDQNQPSVHEIAGSCGLPASKVGECLQRAEAAGRSRPLPEGIADSEATAADPVAQAQQRPRLAARGPIPIGVGQHDVTEQVRMRSGVYDDPQFGGVRPVWLHGPSGFPVLREEHFLVRSVEEALLFNAALKRAQVLVAQAPRSLLL